MHSGFHGEIKGPSVSTGGFGSQINPVRVRHEAVPDLEMIHMSMISWFTQGRQGGEMTCSGSHGESAAELALASPTCHRPCPRAPLRHHPSSSCFVPVQTPASATPPSFLTHFWLPFALESAGISSLERRVRSDRGP